MALALKEQEELAAEMALDEVALANSMAIKCLETNIYFKQLGPKIELSIF